MQLKPFRCFVFFCLSLFIGVASSLLGDNQTPDVSPVITNGQLPFRVRIELADFSLPNGLQSYVVGTYQGQWLLLAGRTNGLHGFNNSPNNFPPETQNYRIYVVDVKKKKVYSRSLNSPDAGLTQDQVDSLAVTASQFHQSGKTLYLIGGYGFKNSVNNFVTFDLLTTLDIPGVIRWVKKGRPGETLAQHIQQISNPVFQITGGDLFKLEKKAPFLLVFGNDFEGAYGFGGTQVYSEQIRRFNILNQGRHHARKHQTNNEELSVEVKSPKPPLPDPNYRRRDLNTVPVMLTHHQQDLLLGRTLSASCNCGCPHALAQARLVPGVVAYGGVFTPTVGAWTVPVYIDAKGNSLMPDPSDPITFKQAMNNYVCANLGLFSEKRKEMYTVFCGGITYGFFQDGVFQTDPDLPFTNQVTTIKIDRQGHYTQYLLDTAYPLIRSTQSNRGNPLLFGADALFISSEKVKEIQYSNKVLMLDKIRKPTLVGYIVGGIQSTLAETQTESDSDASAYIFKVIVEPVKGCK